MVDHLLDEHEQSERVRGWLRQNGAGLIAGIALGLGAIGGWNWWQQNQAGQRVEMGRQYAAVVTAIGANDLKKATAEYAALKDKESDYAALAGMQVARAQALVAPPCRPACAALFGQSRTGDREPSEDTVKRATFARRKGVVSCGRSPCCTTTADALPNVTRPTSPAA